METTRHPAIVLAGGKSTRLGRDKASEVLAGTSLLQRAITACEGVASRFVIVKAIGQQLPEVSAVVAVEPVEDLYPETGPLGGIATGLQALAAPIARRRENAPAEAQVALVVACDMPLLQPALLAELLRLALGHAAVVPVRDGQPEPLCAVYSTACLEPAVSLLEAGDYRVSGLLAAVEALMVPETQWRPFDPQALSFLNVNREEDLVRARSLIGTA